MDSDLAKISEAACTGCGACLASCPTDALDLKGFTNDQLLAEVKAALDGSSGKTVLVFADEMTGYRLADNVGTARGTYSADTRIIRVPSASRVTPKLMLEAFALGAGGILLAESEGKSSPYTGSAAAMKKHVAQTQGVLQAQGIDPDRVRAIEFVTVMLAKFAAEMNGLTALAHKLGPVPDDKRRSIEKGIDELHLVESR